MHKETTRIDIRIPISLLNKVEKYQAKNDIRYRTVALLELVRIGLKVSEEEEKEQNEMS